MLKWFKIFFFCKWWRAHDWTSAAMKGIQPTPKQIADGVDGFWDYATMYCDRCGKESESSKEAKRGRP